MKNKNTDKKVSHRQLLQTDKDYQKAASIAHLTYVSDHVAGIQRIKRENEFVYTHNGKKITDKDTLARIKKLAIPPSWSNLWICPLPQGHIKATGIDLH